MAPSKTFKASMVPLLAALAASCTTVAPPEMVQSGLVIDRVNVVDVRDGSINMDRAIIIEGGRIVRIVAAGSVAAAGSAQRIDGNNAFVVPGYNDMHVHNLNNASPQTSLPLMLANGITGIRQMAPALPNYPRDAAGHPVLPVDAPALLSSSGTLLAGPAFATPETARAEVAAQATSGAEFVKIVDEPPAAFFAAVDAAESAGLRSAGHLSPAVDPREAIAHGFDSIEHLGPGISLLLSCSTLETPIRAAMQSAPPVDIDFTMPPAQLARRLANPMLLTPPQGFGAMRRVLDTQDARKCQQFAADIAASDAWVVPTLTRLEAMNLGNSPALRNNPDLRLVPSASRAMWLAVGDDFSTMLGAEQQQVLADLYTGQLAMLRLFERAGVKMMTGTDFGGQWIVPGRSLHREFDLLAGAGVAPLTILQMTTINPAVYLRREADSGTVEAGRQADLVLLTANPLQDSANLHQIAAVVRAGRFLNRSHLDAITNGAVAALD